MNIFRDGIIPDQMGLVNQRGQSRKVAIIMTQYYGGLNMVFILQNIFATVKASLKRLQLDYIDLLQCGYSRIHYDHILIATHRPSIRL